MGGGGSGGGFVGNIIKSLAGVLGTSNLRTEGVEAVTKGQKEVFKKAIKNTDNDFGIAQAVKSAAVARTVPDAAVSQFQPSRQAPARTGAITRDTTRTVTKGSIGITSFLTSPKGAKKRKSLLGV